MGLLTRLKEAFSPATPGDDPERDERRREAATDAEPGATPDEPSGRVTPAPDDEDWLVERQRLGPGV